MFELILSIQEQIKSEREKEKKRICFSYYVIVEREGKTKKGPTQI